MTGASLACPRDHDSARQFADNTDARTPDKIFCWERSYPNGEGWRVDIAPGVLTEEFDFAVARHSARIAIEFRDIKMSYAELGAAVDVAAAAFLALGIARHDRIALYLPNTPHHPIAFYGALKAGVTVVHLSPLDPERALLHKLEDSGARILVTADAGTQLRMAAALAAAGGLDRVIVCEDARWGGAVPTAALPPDRRFMRLDALATSVPAPDSFPTLSPDDVALLQYTGGTTGVPKGAVLTHANLSAAVAMYNEWFRVQKVGTPGSDRIIAVLPLFHIYALTTILLRQLVNGNTILLHARFDVEAVLHDIEVKRATQFPGVPTMWIALTNHPGIEHRDLGSLQQCLSGGASLPIEVAARFRQLTGLTLRGGWGMTETSPAGTRIPEDCTSKPGTIGIPMPGVELGIVSLDDPHLPLGTGEVGELCVKGANVTSGYWNRPADSAALFADGFLLTGDVGFMDEDGYFFIVDRKKDMIISGGFNVYPQMIEQAIYEHEAVGEVMVVGVPDAYRGEAAKAFIALRPDFDPFTLDTLRDFLRSRLGPHELPASLEFRSALPRTPVGKLSKLDLVRELKQMSAAVQCEVGATGNSQDA